MKRVELALEHFMFASRWLLVPFYVGLVTAVVFLADQILKRFYCTAAYGFWGRWLCRFTRHFNIG